MSSNQNLLTYIFKGSRFPRFFFKVTSTFQSLECRITEDRRCMDAWFYCTDLPNILCAIFFLFYNYAPSSAAVSYKIPKIYIICGCDMIKCEKDLEEEEILLPGTFQPQPDSRPYFISLQ